MKNRQEIIIFFENNIDVLSNPDFGIKNFNEVKDVFSELREMILEMIEIADIVSIPSGLVNRIVTFVNTWNEFHGKIKAYKLEDDARSDFRNRQYIIDSIRQWYNSCLLGFDSQDSNKSNNFLSVFNVIKNFSIKDIDSERRKIAEMVQDIQNQKQTVDSITDEFRKKSGEKTLSDYSIIFLNESQRHSCLKFGWKDTKVGNAEWWLLIGIGLVALFCYLLISENLNRIISLTGTQSQGELLINILTRLIIISTWVYLISFCFKQYSVNKHLATLNRHRSHTLNSFKLFIESLDPGDSLTKNALMIEVAKAIYEQGRTGHLSGKSSESSPSIIELTRFVNQTSS